MLLLVSLSFSLRLLLLLGRPLWFDELFTLWAARLPVVKLLAALRLDSGPPAFYLLEKPFAFFADRFANADCLLRVPAFLAILLLFAAVRTLPRGAARSCFLALLSGSALLNLYAAEARPYALLGLLCLTLFRLAVHGEETGRRLWGVVGIAALALYTHYLAAFAVLALVVLTAAARRWRSCAALLAGAALFAPWVPVLLTQPAQAVEWMRESWSGSILGFSSALGGVGRVPSPFGPPAPSPLFVSGAAMGALCLLLLLGMARRDRDARNSAAFVGLVLAGALAAGFWSPIVFAGRTELTVLPVWFWGISRCALESRAMRRACAAVVALGLLATFAVALHSHAPSAPAAVTESLARVAGTDDLVIASTAFYLPARLAHERGELAASIQAMPASLGAHPGWFVPSLPGREEENLLAAAMESLPPGRHLFVVVPPEYATAGLARVLARGGGRSRQLMRSREALVTLWTRDR